MCYSLRFVPLSLGLMYFNNIINANIIAVKSGPDYVSELPEFLSSSSWHRYACTSHSDFDPSLGLKRSENIIFQLEVFYKTTILS